MTEFSSKVSFPGLDEAANQWKRLGEEIKDAVNEADSDGFVDLADAFNVATEAAGKLFNAAGEILGGLKDMGEEMERVAGISNRFNGNIDEAARRTNGLVTELDLMIASNTAAAAGLDLTGEQFANIAVAASEFAAATGGDATEAINKLSRAVAAGEEGALREFNVTLGDATTQADRQSAALNSLRDEYGSMESSADTLGGRIAVLENRLEDAKDEFTATLAQSGALKRAFDSLTGSVNRVGEALGLSFGDNGAGVREWAIVTGAVIEATAGQFASLIATVVATGQAIEAFVTRDFVAVATALDQAIEAQSGIGVAAFDRDVTGSIRESNLQERLTEKRGRAGTPGGTKGEQGGGRNDADIEALARAAEEALERQLELESALAEKQKVIAEAEENRLSAKRDLADAAEREAAALEKQIDAERRAREEAEERRDALERLDEHLDSVEERRNEIAAKSEEGFRGILDIGLETARLVRESNASIGEAFKTAIDQWLKSFAIQEAYKGVAALAEGIGNAVMNTGHATAKFAEAGIHFAVAAAAGGASLAIPNAGGGGGAGASRPEAVGGGGGGGGGNGGTTVININNPTARSEMGKEQARADRADKRRNG